MKRILYFLFIVLFASGCASLPKQSCEVGLMRPYFFEQGEKLAAFRMILSAGSMEIEGILQIKKTDVEQYDITIFSTAGAYRMLQATLTREGAQYSFLVPSADRSAVRIKAERFLSLLLFPAQSAGSCKVKNEGVRVHYKHAPMMYEYEKGAKYPEELIGPKFLGKVHLTFEDYKPYEDGQLPHQLHYRDGKVKVDLTLLRLKK